MRMTISSRAKNAGLLAIGLFLLAAPTEADAAQSIPYGKGTTEKGKIVQNLYRGAAVPFELSIPPLPQSCGGEVELTLEWNEKANWVKVKLRSDKNTLVPFPDVDRTEGVNYFPNAFYPEPEDIEDGRYQLWIVSAAGPLVVFYYSFDTLDLLGSEYDFDEAPMAIPVPFPSLYMFATPMFQPKPNGKVQLDWQFPYDGAHRGDRPEFSHHYITFPPPNLCYVNQFRLDQSALRPYITAPLPRSEARPWSDYLRGGLLFDITIEPAEYYTEPPVNMLIGTYSGGTAIGGTIPRGWQLDIEAAFANLAPPIKVFEGRDSCEMYTEPMHVGAGIPFCQG